MMGRCEPSGHCDRRQHKGPFTANMITLEEGVFLNPLFEFTLAVTLVPSLSLQK